MSACVDCACVQKIVKYKQKRYEFLWPVTLALIEHNITMPVTELPKSESINKTFVVFEMFIC